MISSIQNLICFWNANSINCHLPFVEQFIHEKSPLILAACESHLSQTSTYVPTIHQYHTLSYPHTNHSGGHVYFIHDSVIFRELISCHLAPSSSSSSQISAIELLTPLSPKPVILVLVYISPAMFANDVDSITQSLYAIHTQYHASHDFIVGGDFNCKNSYFARLLPHQTTTHLSSHLVTCIKTLDLICLNMTYCPNQPTYSPSKSVLDLVFTSNSRIVSDTYIDPKSDLLSDHIPLCVILSNINNIHSVKNSQFSAWNTKSVNWPFFETTLSTFLESWSTFFDQQLADASLPQFTYNAPYSSSSENQYPASETRFARYFHQFICDSVWLELKDSILTAGQLCVGHTVRQSVHQLKGWWQHETGLKSALNDMKYNYRRYLRHRSNPHLKHAYTDARSIFRNLRDSAIQKWKETSSRKVQAELSVHSINWDGWNQVSKHSSIQTFIYP